MLRDDLTRGQYAGLKAASMLPRRAPRPEDTDALNRSMPKKRARAARRWRVAA
jgi:hypothetical protein